MAAAAAATTEIEEQPTSNGRTERRMINLQEEVSTTKSCMPVRMTNYSPPNRFNDLNDIFFLPFRSVAEGNSAFRMPLELFAGRSY